jgi:ABC-type transport system involved in multi-copper enzyme maturation permease subunit
MNDKAGVIAYSTGARDGNASTQTVALFVDAYRELQSRKLFWITLILSTMVALVFATVGLNERGFTILGWTLPSALNTSIMPVDTFYKFMYVELAIPFWLGICATVLALIATGGIFPEMISGGSIDLYLSRPIGRLRLFLTKYTFGLLFAASQVFVFSLASFLVVGIRGGAWELRMFLAVPLVTLFFSYIYCVCVLLGVVTRSALASILLTVLFWFGLWVIHKTDMALTTMSAAADERVERQQATVEFNQQVIDKNQSLPQEQRANVSAYEFQRDAQKQKLTEYQETADQLHWWHGLFFAVKTPLPKTAETVQLMSRWLVGPDPLLKMEKDRQERREERRARRGGPTSRDDGDDLWRTAGSIEVSERVYEEVTGRKVSWIVGSSLGFEAVVLGLAAWVFCRRDY